MRATRGKDGRDGKRKQRLGTDDHTFLVHLPPEVTNQGFLAFAIPATQGSHGKASRKDEEEEDEEEEEKEEEEEEEEEGEEKDEEEGDEERAREEEEKDGDREGDGEEAEEGEEKKEEKKVGAEEAGEKEKEGKRLDVGGGPLRSLHEHLTSSCGFNSGGGATMRPPLLSDNCPPVRRLYLPTSSKTRVTHTNNELGALANKRRTIDLGNHSKSNHATANGGVTVGQYSDESWSSSEESEILVATGGGGGGGSGGGSSTTIRTAFHEDDWAGTAPYGSDDDCCFADDKGAAATTTTAASSSPERLRRKIKSKDLPGTFVGKKRASTVARRRRGGGGSETDSGEQPGAWKSMADRGTATLSSAKTVGGTGAGSAGIGYNSSSANNSVTSGNNSRSSGKRLGKSQGRSRTLPAQHQGVVTASLGKPGAPISPTRPPSPLLPELPLTGSSHHYDAYRRNSPTSPNPDLVRVKDGPLNRENTMVRKKDVSPLDIKIRRRKRQQAPGGVEYDANGGGGSWEGWDQQPGDGGRSRSCGPGNNAEGVFDEAPSIDFDHEQHESWVVREFQARVVEARRREEGDRGVAGSTAG